MIVVRAMSASSGDMVDYLTGSAIFPRINVKDPYKRLGISKMASEDEIQGARNFLIQQYAGHKPSVDAIESELMTRLSCKSSMRGRTPRST